MRIYVKISDEMGEKLDHYSTKFGMSKSAFVAYAVGKHINELEYQAQAYQVVGDKLSTGDVLATIYTNGKNTEQAISIVLDAYSLTKNKVNPRPTIIETIR